jgi:4-hydroxy-tetrahydrodipicolinate synthase
MKRLKGTHVVMVTPFAKDRKVDYGGIKTNIEWWIENGVHGIMPLGSTGEFASLEDGDKKRIVETVVESVDGRVPVIAGATAETTEKAIYYASQVKAIGADAALILPPYYFSADQDELYHHYKTIAENVDLPLMLYNNPSSSKVDISADTVVKLNKLPNIKYIKECTGDIRRITEIKLRLADAITVFCGWEDMALESFLLGAEGWVSVIANIVPAQAAELYNLVVEKNDIKKAFILYKKMLPMLRYLETRGKTQQILKYCLDSIGLCGGYSTNPRLPLSPDEEHLVKDYFDAIQQA